MAQAVVIGGGFIGVSVTEALLKRGVEVTIVEMKERILNTLLDEETSALEEETLRQAGVNIVTGHTVADISSYSEDVATSVILDDGNRVSCNLVVIAIGVLPRTELVSDTSIKVNRGIVVNRNMATSSPDVYACGDVAEAYDFIYGGNRLTPIWPNAYVGGRIAGFNMAGIPTEYPGGTVMNSLKYFGLNITVAGMVNPPDDSYEVLSQKYNNSYRKVVLKDGLVVGMVFTGDIEKSGIIFALMKDGVNIDGFKQALVAEDFGLASLPEEIWRPQLEMPPSMLASLAVSVEQPEEMVMGE
jgi:NAD(P)H-nitrite reductase large subunit